MANDLPQWHKPPFHSDPDATMNPFWSQMARELSPYVPGEQPRIADLVKLNTNESPFGPSPRALQAMRAAAADSLRLYPDPEATGLGVTVVRVGAFTVRVTVFEAVPPRLKRADAAGRGAAAGVLDGVIGARSVTRMGAVILRERLDTRQNWPFRVNHS